MTSLLSAIAQGERDALEELYALLYPELHHLAHSRVRRSGDMTALATGATAAFWQRNRALQQAKRARAALARAEQVKTFIGTRSRPWAPSSSFIVSAGQLLVATSP